MFISPFPFVRILVHSFSLYEQSQLCPALIVVALYVNNQLIEKDLTQFKIHFIYAHTQFKIHMTHWMTLHWSIARENNFY